MAAKKPNPLMPLLKSVRTERDKYRDKCLEYQGKIEALELHIKAQEKQVKARDELLQELQRVRSVDDPEFPWGESDE